MKNIMIIVTILKRQMEQYFSNLFENIRYERSLFQLLSLTDPDIIGQTNFTDHELNIKKKLALEKLHRQRNLKEYVAMDLLGKQFSN